MSPRTTFLSRLLGLYCILGALALVARGNGAMELVGELLRNGPLMFIVGVFTLLAGLAMILAHNVWSGGALPVIVTLIGWLTALKGLVFLVLPPDAAAKLFLVSLDYGRFFYFYAAFSFGIGVCLAYKGFASPSNERGEG
ncbi:MAG: hypothetical protein ACHQ49_10505 [Elusimicrobiota bacterium]